MATLGESAEKDELPILFKQIYNAKDPKMIKK